MNVKKWKILKLYYLEKDNNEKKKTLKNLANFFN